MIRRRALLSVMLLLPVAGCGFQPLYGSHGQRGDLPDLAEVTVGPMNERLGQMMRNALLDGIGATPGVKKRYRLDMGVAEQRQDLSFQRGGEQAYSRLAVTCRYTLTDMQTGEVLLSNSDRVMNSFATVATGFGTVQAQNDARERAVRQMASDVLTRVGIHLRNRRNPS